MSVTESVNKLPCVVCLTCLQGDFFRSVPVKADCYVMKSILHDWDDQHCITILTHLRASMPPGSVLVNFDRLLPDCGTPGFHPAKAMDVNMMVSYTAAPAFNVLAHTADIDCWQHAAQVV